jgi:cytochrome c oxidase cbb3-type subunit II
MSRSSNLFAGLFGTFALSAVVLVLAPQAQLGGLQQHFVEDEPGKFSEIYPVQGHADVAEGRNVYAREGCMHCHTQQVRDPQNGTDIERGWGARRTVARDYLFEEPPFLGTSRIGPDLANVGSPEWRNEPKDDIRKPAKRDAAWHYLHLYAPQTIITESNHPPYRYLFETRKISGQRSADALNLTGANAPEDGYEVIPTAGAKTLVAYLLSLDRSRPLKEAQLAADATAAAAPASGSAPAAAK